MQSSPLHLSVILDPSNGSIQFLHASDEETGLVNFYLSQSPQTGQFNSYTLFGSIKMCGIRESQSPQTGQFNSYSFRETKLDEPN